jgi:pyridoxamine 5'-phosphate oxidase
MKIDHLREDYDHGGLRRADLARDPVDQLRRWLQEALDANLPEPTAMTLATADAAGRPAARTVLLKGCDDRGLAFYTNYGSRKGRELEVNPRAALLFFWQPLHRQVRVEGAVARLSREESAAYFHSRPRGSQLGAWASPQSAVIESREELDRRLAEVEERFRDQEIPLPPHWGGYRLEPEEAELWQGRRDRLHDRFRYRRTSDGWTVERLGP